MPSGWQLYISNKSLATVGQVLIIILNLLK